MRNIQPPKQGQTVERQGKEFILYRGLLDIAHGAGLQHISTELLQIPNESNKNVAIVKAAATFVEKADGADLLEDRYLTFCGIGDAAPNNVAPAMQTCLIRMAETRAKGRAIRDGVNFGEAVFEELGNEEEAEPAPMKPRPGNQTRSKAAAASQEDVQAANVSEGTSEHPAPETTVETAFSNAQTPATEPKAAATPANLDPKKMREAFWNNAKHLGIDNERMTQDEAKKFLTSLYGGTYPKDWGVETWKKLGSGMARYIKAMQKHNPDYKTKMIPYAVYLDYLKRVFPGSKKTNHLLITATEWESMASNMEEYLKTQG